MNRANKINMDFPLVASYNTRGLTANTNRLLVLDQRKINSTYDIVKNNVSGKVTPYLVSRPRITNTGSGSYNITDNSIRSTFHLTWGAGLYGDAKTDLWSFYTNSTDACKVATDDTVGVTTTVLTSTGFYPAYVNKTLISGVDTITLQLRNAALSTQRTWFTSTMTGFTEVSSAAFGALTKVGAMQHLDGFGFIADQATNRIYNSDLNTLHVWQPLSFITKQIKNDQIQGLAKLGKKIPAFGRYTTEVFVNAGTETGSPLVSIPGLFFEAGIVDIAGNGKTHYAAIVGGNLYFVGQESSISAALYMFDGGAFHKVSNGPFSAILTELRDSIYAVSRFSFGGREAVAIMTSPPVPSVANSWLMYFPEWNEWFEWSSDNFLPIGTGRFFVSPSPAQAFRFASVSSDAIVPDTQSFVHQFQLPKMGNDWKRMQMCQLMGDTARSAQSVIVQFSDDDGQTWSASTRAIDMTSIDKASYRLGAYRERIMRLTYTGTPEIRLERFGASIG